MTGFAEPERVLRSVTPTSAPDRPSHFEAWGEDIKVRTFELWSSIAAGSAPRTEYLLAAEAGEGVAVPAASTIRRWAVEDGWADQRDKNLAATQGRTLRQLQATSLSAIALAQQTMLDAMTGLLDAAPYGGSGRIKAAESILRLAERSGLELVVAPADVSTEDTGKPLSLQERSRRMREMIVADNKLS